MVSSDMRPLEGKPSRNFPVGRVVCSSTEEVAWARVQIREGDGEARRVRRAGTEDVVRT